MRLSQFIESTELYSSNKIIDAIGEIINDGEGYLSAAKDIFARGNFTLPEIKKMLKSIGLNDIIPDVERYLKNRSDFRKVHKMNENISDQVKSKNYIQLEGNSVKIFDVKMKDEDVSFNKVIATNLDEKYLIAYIETIWMLTDVEIIGPSTYKPDHYILYTDY